jgi:hypothetical protein
MRIFSNILMSVSLLVAGLLFLSCDSIAGGDKNRKPYDGVQARNTERRNDIREHQRDRRDDFKEHRKDRQLRSGRQD